MAKTMRVTILEDRGMKYALLPPITINGYLGRSDCCIRENKKVDVNNEITRLARLVEEQGTIVNLTRPEKRGLVHYIRHMELGEGMGPRNKKRALENIEIMFNKATS